MHFKFFRNSQISVKRLWGFVGIYFVITLLNLAQPEVLRRTTDAITNRSAGELKTTLFLAVGSTLLYLLITYVRDIYQVKTVNFYRKSFSRILLNRLVDIKMKVLDKKQFGDVSTTVIRNLDGFCGAVIDTISSGSSGFISLVITFIYMCVIEWRLAVCILLYNVVIRFSAVFVERKIKKNVMEMSNAFKTSGNYLSSLLRNMLTVRIYSNRDFFRNRLKKNETAVMKMSWKNFVWTNGFQDSIWAFSKLAEFLIVCGVGALLIINEKTDISILLTFIFANDLFTIGINSISWYLIKKAEASAYQATIEELLDETELENEKTAPLVNVPFSIRFENVSFGYGETTILKDINFTINPGEKVLLKGPNGHGKSTILKLIAGLYRPDSGTISFGDRRTNGIHISSLRETYGYISQSANILEGSVAENIALSETLDSKKVDMVLKKLNLSDVKGNNPKSLSLGEQQRLNIGRVFYAYGRAVIIGDEIFSNIDFQNREAVLDVLNHEYQDSTVIIISHESLDYAFDRVLVVENGQIREEAA